MADMSRVRRMRMHGHSPGVVLRSLVIGLTAFLTVVDLFATQAILPSLTRHYGVTPGRDGLRGQCQHHRHGGRRPRGRASSAGISTAGSASSSACVLLAIPTTLLASAPDLTVFTILRIAQGLCMASAFALTLAYLGEQCSSMDAGGAFAAYITGNVASNLIGRLVSAAVADHSGLASNFYFFAAAQSCRRGAGLFHHSARQADERCRRRSRRSRQRLAHLAQSGAARGLRHRLLHPVRLHRHLHLRQLRAGARSRCRSAGWSSASSISCFCRRSSRRCSRARAVARFGTRPAIWGGARGRRRSACRCCCPRTCRQC